MSKLPLQSGFFLVVEEHGNPPNYFKVQKLELGKHVLEEGGAKVHVQVVEEQGEIRFLVDLDHSEEDLQSVLLTSDTFEVSLGSLKDDLGVAGLVLKPAHAALIFAGASHETAITYLSFRTSPPVV